MAKIGIDIGHGSDTFPNNGKGVYRGGKGYAEHSFNAKLGLALKKLLEDKGHTIIFGQQPNKPDVSLSSRTNLYNRENVDLVISLHANYNANSVVDGRCVFYWHTSDKSKKLAELVAGEIKKLGYSTHGNGLHSGVPGTWTELHINRESKMPSVLVEHGFMGNDKDFELIFGSKQTEYVADMAKANFNAIQRYLGASLGGKWSTNDFLKSIKTGAIKSWEQHKVLPSLVGAQAALESGWGKSGLAKDGNNLFGIKAGNGWKGDIYTSETKEFINGEWIVTRADFRAYDNWADSVADHGAFFTSTDFRKDNYKAVIGEKDYKKAVAAILEPVAKSGYATDPNYADKIINIIEEWDLAEWDAIAMGPQAKPKPVNPVAKPTSTLSGIVRSEKENGRFQVGKTLYVFERPDETSKHVATYKVGEPPVVYHTIHYGNGYLWLQYTRAGGKGEGYIACRTYTNGKLGPMFGEILGDVPKPKPVAKKTYVKLSAKVAEWRIYNLGVAPVAGKEKGKLRPAKFGGLEYEVLGYQDGGATAIIQTGDYGKGKIFLDSDATVYSR